MIPRLVTALFVAGLIVAATAIPSVAGPDHRTTVTLRLSGRLIASGVVRVADDTRACRAHRLVLIQLKENRWRTVADDRTRANGTYRDHIPDEPGRYRAVIQKKLIAGHPCTRDVSPVVDHSSGGGGGGSDNHCTSGYSPCLEYHGGVDYDCAGGSGDGPYYTSPGVTYRVTGSDPYGLDGNNDGYGCE